MSEFCQLIAKVLADKLCRILLSDFKELLIQDICGLSFTLLLRHHNSPVHHSVQKSYCMLEDNLRLNFHSIMLSCTLLKQECVI